MNQMLLRNSRELIIKSQLILCFSRFREMILLLSLKIRLSTMTLDVMQYIITRRIWKIWINVYRYSNWILIQINPLWKTHSLFSLHSHLTHSFKLLMLILLHRLNNLALKVYSAKNSHLYKLNSLNSYNKDKTLKKSNSNKRLWKTILNPRRKSSTS